MNTIMALVLAGAMALYPNAATITDVNYDNDIVIVEDHMGQLWSYHGAEDYEVGDLVGLIMCDNGTPNNIKDDIVIDHKYLWCE